VLACCVLCFVYDRHHPLFFTRLLIIQSTYISEPFFFFLFYIHILDYYRVLYHHTHIHAFASCGPDGISSLFFVCSVVDADTPP